MSIKVTINSPQNVVTAVKTNKTAVSLLTPNAPSLSLGQLTNVDTSDSDDGEALIFDSSVNKYVIKQITVNSNNITNIAGGTF